jgi:hypothetical protein
VLSRDGERSVSFRRQLLGQAMRQPADVALEGQFLA